MVGTIIIFEVLLEAPRLEPTRFPLVASDPFNDNEDLFLSERNELAGNVNCWRPSKAANNAPPIKNSEVTPARTDPDNHLKLTSLRSGVLFLSDWLIGSMSPRNQFFVCSSVGFMIIGDALTVVWAADTSEMLQWFASNARMLYIQICRDAIRDRLGAMQQALRCKLVS